LVSVSPRVAVRQHHEAAPLAAPAAQAGVGAQSEATTAASAPDGLVWSGDFQSLAHETSGSAQTLQLADGSRVLRLADFATSNGPDVRVYLVRGNDGTDSAVIARGEFIDLGALKGNRGNQNYDIPLEINLDDYQSVSIWCRRFSVNFGGTSLGAGS
jgi:hypothetical protein